MTELHDQQLALLCTQRTVTFSGVTEPPTTAYLEHPDRQLAMKCEKCEHSLYSLEHCIYDRGLFSISLKNFQTVFFVIPVEVQRAAHR